MVKLIMESKIEIESNLDIDPKYKKKETIVYQKWNLELIDKNFKIFCQKYRIDYKYAKEIGIENSKKILRDYYTDKLDGNLSKEECDHLYSLMDDPWDCSQLIRHKILADLIFNAKANKKFEKILILGAGLGGEYYHLRKKYPEATFSITDISKNALGCFKLKYKENNDFSTHILDAFSGRSLFEFILKHDKFDLVITSGVYRYAPSKPIRRKSAQFLFKHYLKTGGMLCIVEVRQDPKYDNPLLLKRTRPVVDKIIQTKTRINPTHFVFYLKNRLKGGL